jgi:hypothetical protein
VRGITQRSPRGGVSGAAAARTLPLTLTVRIRFNFSRHDRPAWSAAQAPLPRKMRDSDERDE